MSEPIEVEHKVICKSVAMSIIIISLTSIYVFFVFINAHSVYMLNDLRHSSLAEGSDV